jgi:hypothetical protein
MARRVRGQVVRKLVFTAPIYIAYGVRLLCLLGCYTVGL